jgi:hypothetical protein
LASLANSLGVSFGRKKKGDSANATMVPPTSTEEADSIVKGDADRTQSSASDLLKRF